MADSPINPARLLCAAPPSFPRQQRRRPSITGGNVRPDLFEKLWSAHAAPTAWQSSFRPGVKIGAKLTSREESLIESWYQRSTPEGFKPFEPLHLVSIRNALSEILNITLCATDESLIVALQQSHSRTSFRKRDEEHSLSTIITEHQTFNSELVDSPRQSNDHIIFQHHLNMQPHLLDLRAIFAFCQEVKETAVVDGRVSVQGGLGNSTVAEDPYSSASEVTCAFEALGGTMLGEGAVSRGSTLVALQRYGAATDQAAQELSRRQQQSAQQAPRRSANTIPSTSKRPESQMSTPDSTILAPTTVLSLGKAKVHIAPPTNASESITGAQEQQRPWRGGDEVDFAAFQASLLSIDAWKATSARLFATLGGDPTDPTSTVPLRTVAVAFRNILLREVSEAVAADMVHKFIWVHSATDGEKNSFSSKQPRSGVHQEEITDGGFNFLSQDVASIGISFEHFDLEIVGPLRRVCSGALSGDGDTGASAGPSGAVGGSGGSAGLMQMLNFMPTTALKRTHASQLHEALNRIASKAQLKRSEYYKIRSKINQLFKEKCILKSGPLDHLVHLKRRRLLRVAHLVEQRRTLYLRHGNKYADAVLRCLVAAAKLLGEHAQSCKHCKLRDLITHPEKYQVISMTSPTNATRPRAAEPAMTQSPRSPSLRLRGDSFSLSARNSSPSLNAKRMSPVAPPSDMFPDLEMTRENDPKPKEKIRYPKLTARKKPLASTTVVNQHGLVLNIFRRSQAARSKPTEPKAMQF